MDSPECPHWTIRELGMWCAQSLEEMLYVPIGDGTQPIWRVRPPDYTLLSDDQSCLGEDAKKDQSPKSDDQQKTEQYSDKNEFVEFINNIPFISVPILESFKSTPQFAGLIGFDMVTDPNKITKTTGIDFQELLDRKPAITPKDEEEAWVVPIKFVEPKTKDEKQGQVTTIKGQAQVKYITTDGFIEIINMGESDVPIFVTYMDSIFSGATSEIAQFRYTWGDGSGAMINVPQLTEIKFLEPLKDKTTQAVNRALRLNKGEMEIKVRNVNSQNKFGVQTDFLELYVIGTHFWVTHDPEKKYTLVGVYEGNVEVMTKDGKTTTITPDGDKPGIVVVSQKLSIMKLALFGVGLVAVIAGLAFFLKKKISSNRKHKGADN